MKNIRCYVVRVTLLSQDWKWKNLRNISATQNILFQILMIDYYQEKNNILCCYLPFRPKIKTGKKSLIFQKYSTESKGTIEKYFLTAFIIGIVRHI